MSLWSNFNFQSFGFDTLNLLGFWGVWKEDNLKWEIGEIRGEEGREMERIEFSTPLPPLLWVSNITISHFEDFFFFFFNYKCEHTHHTHTHTHTHIYLSSFKLSIYIKYALSSSIYTKVSHKQCTPQK